MKKESGKVSQKKPKHNIEKAKQPGGKPFQKTEKEHIQVSEQPQIKFEWKFQNPKFRASLLFFIFVIFFFLVWKEPEVKSIDPWYEGYLLVDSSVKVTDPNVKKQLLEQGGDILRKQVKEYPYHAKVHLLLGVYYQVSGKIDSAIVEHRESRKLGAGGTINPVEQDAARQLVNCYLIKSNHLLQLGDYSGARNTIDEAIADKLENPDIDNQIGIIFHKQGMLDSAEFYYNKCLVIVPTHQSAMANLALILFFKGNNFLKEGKYDKALSQYQQSIQLSQKNQDVYINLGYLYSLQNKLDDAVKAYQKAIEIKPDSKIAVTSLINVYKRKGDTRSADALSKQYGLNQ